MTAEHHDRELRERYFKPCIYMSNHIILIIKQIGVKKFNISNQKTCVFVETGWGVLNMMGARALIQKLIDVNTI
jgi:hypothetical protein